MKKRTMAAAALAIGAGTALYLRRAADPGAPPVMTRTGETVGGGLVVRRRTVDYETVLRAALTERTSLIVATLKADVVRDQNVEASIRYTPLPASTARVRVRYHVEYPIGFALGPGDFDVSREGGSLVVTVGPPRLVARPSVRLLSYEVLESGILVDEKTAIIELQRRIQPEAERRGRDIVGRPGVRARGERALRRFVEDALGKFAEPGSDPPPPVVIRYR